MINKFALSFAALLAGASTVAGAQASGPAARPVVVGTEAQAQAAAPGPAAPGCGSRCTHERKTSRMVMFVWLGGSAADAARISEEDGRELDALYAGGLPVHNRRNSMYLTVRAASEAELRGAGKGGVSCAPAAAARPGHRWLRTVIRGDPIDSCHWAYRSSHRD